MPERKNFFLLLRSSLTRSLLIYSSISMLTFDYLQAYYIFQTEVRIATRSSCIRSHNQPILYINGNSSSALGIRWWQNLDGFTMFMIDGFSHSHPNPLHPDPLPSRRVGFFLQQGRQLCKKICTSNRGNWEKQKTCAPLFPAHFAFVERAKKLGK